MCVGNPVAKDLVGYLLTKLEIFKERKIRSKHNRRACIKKVMHVKQPLEICKNRNKSKKAETISVVFVYLDGKKGVDVLVCMYF